MLLLIAVILALADLITTLIGVRLAGAEGESNPLWRRLIAKYGVAAYSAAYLGLAGVLIFVFAKIGPEALWGYAACMALVVATNLYAIARLLRR
jgi:hypothetical protein